MTRKILTREAILTSDMTEGKARLWRFIDAVKHGETPPPNDLAVLAESFDKILNGEDPKKALEIGGEQSSGRKARSGPAIYEIEVKPVIKVEELRQKGIRLEEALDIVSQGTPIIPRDTLVRYEKRHRERALAYLEMRKGIKRFSEQMALVENSFGNVAERILRSFNSGQ